ncbi:unnamed protein product [Adineta steineri]|uniref:Uncharacterized protein n=1 Tax=Adineta steineri TaxID=433720 RepID=A0A815P7U2_9BILA|nr:unnamed protein product [Adineta steineri]CAF1629004.1 unnamed protein product [Adineta steineri]
MFDASVYPKSIYISTVQTGCITIEFNSTYPFYLIGIINRDEYRESIQQINRAMSFKKMLLIVSIIFSLTLVIGMTLTILGAGLQENTSTTQFPTLTGVGISLLFCASSGGLVGFSFIRYRLTRQIQEAVAKESMKYSSRTPIPCTWRLETKTHWCGTYENGQYQRLVYRIVIDIGNSPDTSGNLPPYSDQIITETTSLIKRENDLPPPYSSLSTEFHV